MKSLNLSHYHELCNIFTKIRTRGEAMVLLRDLLTPRETASIVERLQIVKLLSLHKPYREISKTLGVSIDKVTRGARAFRYSRGGFRMLMTQKKYWWRQEENSWQQVAK